MSNIIDKPELQSPAQKYLFGSVTLGLWFIYLYMWLPLISVLAWLLGAQLFYERVIERGGLHLLAHDLRRYGEVIVVMVAVYLGWALVNYYRFRTSRRSTQLHAVDISMLAKHFNVDEADVNRLQWSRVLELTHDDEGNVLYVRPVAVRSRQHPAPVTRLWPRRGARRGGASGPGGRHGMSAHGRRRLAIR